MFWVRCSMFVAYYVLVVWWCSLRVVCCSLFLFGCMSFADCSLLLVVVDDWFALFVCCLFVACWLFVVVCCLLF